MPDPLQLDEKDVFRCEKCHNRTTFGAVCVTLVGLLCRRCADARPEVIVSFRQRHQDAPRSTPRTEDDR